MSKIGLHVLQGPRNGYGAFLQRIAAEGEGRIVIKVLDDMGAAYEAKAYLGARALTVGRFDTIDGVNMQAWEPAAWPSAEAAADAYYALVRSKWDAHRFIDVWETFNEFSEHWAWQADFFIRMMDRSQPDGFTLASFASSSGNPPSDDVSAAAFIKVGQRAKRGGHYLSLHEYGGVPPVTVQTLRGTEPYHALRYRGLYVVLKDNDADCGLIISEAGQAAGHTALWRVPGYTMDDYIADVEWYDSELMRDDYVAGAALWTLGQYQQTDSNIQDALPRLADYIITHPTEEVRYQVVVNLLPQDATLDEKAEVLAAVHDARQTILQSADDAKRLVKPGRPGSHVRIWGAERWDSADAIVRYLDVPYTLEQFAGAPPPEPFVVTHWPTDYFVVTQPFDARPEYYRQFGLPGHEGIDIRGLPGTNVYAIADGIVTEVETNPDSGNYGVHLTLTHNEGFRSKYCHLQTGSIKVAMGQAVMGGDVLAFADTTGNTDASHLHMNLYQPGALTTTANGTYPPEIVDPWPWIEPIFNPPPPAQKTLVGLHMSADPGDLIQAEYNAIGQGRVQCAKVLSATPPETIDRLVAAGIPVGNIIVRLFMAGDDPNLIDASKYWGVFRGVIAPLYAKGVRYFEVHNEPNWIGEWPLTAASFANWFRQVSIAAHAEYPEILVGFPGLSPRDNVTEWLDACDDVIATDADWIGVHCYWVKRDTPENPQPGGMYHPESGGYWQRFEARYPFRELIITEYVNVAPAPYSMAEKAQEALDWMAALPGDRIPMTFWYCSRASNVEYAQMVWMSYTGQMNEVAGIIGGRTW